MMRILFALLVFLIAYGTTRGAENSAEVTPAIVVVGDSLSAAYGMQLDESWPSLLQEHLKQHGYAHRVFNSSITGDTTQGGRSRLPRLLDKHRPDLVIIELGGNDGLRGLPLEVTRGNLAFMIQASLDAGAQVILTEIMIPPNYGASYTEQFTANFSKLAAEYGVVLVPFILQDIALAEGMMQADGIHPTAAAQPLILDQYWTVLQTLLDQSE